MFKGIAASPGYGAGQALVLRSRPERKGRQVIARSLVDTEQNRLTAALQRAGQQLIELEEKAQREMGADEAQVFAAHQLFLLDPEFGGAMTNLIGSGLVTAETAVHEVTDQFVAIFDAMDDAYMRERVADIKDVGGRIFDNLLGVAGPDWAGIAGKVVVIAHDLTPSDTAQLDRSKVVAFATAIGGRTSHSAIMARTLEIPAVVGIQGLLDAAQDGHAVLVDGETGTVIINPDADTAADFAVKAECYREQRESLRRLVHVSSVTPDGHQVELGANIGKPADVATALANGAEGVGLFRSEFLYMDRTDLPSEEEQYEAYRQVVKSMGGKSVIIRTLDIGGDKELPYLDMPKEMNPFLGYRAIRLCLDRPELFQTQLRAILRASAHGNVKIMFPMIATLGEVRQAKEQVRIAMAGLRQRGAPFNESVSLGIMVETPAAAIIACTLAHEVDFFSIGTNDLVQYTMACDRMNERISYLYQPLEPAVLRLIQMVIDAAHTAGKWAGMCGEMAGDPHSIPLLLGMGLDEFSMSPASVLGAREVITRTSLAQAREIARAALTKKTAEEVRECLAQACQGGMR